MKPDHLVARLRATRKELLSNLFGMNAEAGYIYYLFQFFDGQPCWSRDGSKIAFVSNRGGTYVIYTMNASDGSGLTAVNPNDHYSAHPVWSRDDRQIGFDADNDLDGWQELWKINTDGSGAALLLDANGEAIDYTASDWTANNKLLLFTRSNWVYQNNQWYWIRATTGWYHTSGNVNYSFDNSYTEWNETTAPSEHIAPDVAMAKYASIPPTLAHSNRMRFGLQSAPVTDKRAWGESGWNGRRKARPIGMSFVLKPVLIKIPAPASRFMERVVKPITFGLLC